MSGLYGDLPQAKNASEASVPAWGATPKLQPIRKPSTPLAPPPTLLRGRGGGRQGPPPAGRGAGGRTPSSVAAASPVTAPPQEPSQQQPAQDGVQGPGQAQPSAHSLFAAVRDEYDPMRPNDYEEVLKERERAKREAEVEAERIARVKEMEATMERLKKQEEREGGVYAVKDEGAFPPPPSLDVSGEEAYARRGRLGAGLGAAAPGASAASDGAASAADAEESERGMTLAQKMLRKMGWKEGEGLGRNRQGISAPLVMQKTNARAGVIVEGAAPSPQAPPGASPASRYEPPEKKPRGAAITGTPTHVLCLRNMVGPGEVDDELEEEVGEECTKYGPVKEVMIFEVTAPGFPSEEAVRIFVQFERVESATKALVDLQGRYFGGRNVRVAFFSEERFQAEDLAPKPGEFE